MRRRGVVTLAVASLALATCPYCGNAPATPAVQTTPSPSSGPVEQVPPPVVKRWAVLFYDDAEFSNGYDPMDDFRIAMAASPSLHVLVLRDTTRGPTEAYYVDEAHQTHRVRNFGELNMGEAETFRAFARFAGEAFPAERRVVAFYDHGGGWLGCCIDETAGPGELLSMHEIGAGLRELGHVDAVLFTAPCLMGALESAYELRDLTDAYVASEETSGFAFWMNTPLSWLDDTLTRSPGIAAADLADGLVRRIAESATGNAGPYAGSLTMSAVRPARLPAVVSALDGLVRELRDRSAWDALDAAADEVQKYDEKSMVDLVDLMSKLAGASGSAGIRKRAAAVTEAVESALIVEAHGDARPGSHGLTILLPRAGGSWLPPPYRDAAEHLDFAADSQWDELMLDYDARSPFALRPWSAHPAHHAFAPRR